MTSNPEQDGLDPAVSARIRPYLHGAPAEPPVADPGADDLETTVVGLRPFVLTAGRVHGLDPDIGLETQVTARATDTPEHRLAPEQQAIIALCREPVSVAEISAHLRLQLGVTRVLVGDLRATGHLDIHRLNPALPHDPNTILRVMRGLRSIS